MHALPNLLPNLTQNNVISRGTVHWQQWNLLHSINFVIFNLWSLSTFCDSTFIVSTFCHLTFCHPTFCTVGPLHNLSFLMMHGGNYILSALPPSFQSLISKKFHISRTKLFNGHQLISPFFSYLDENSADIFTSHGSAGCCALAHFSKHHSCKRWLWSSFGVGTHGAQDSF